jgi:hypothetical protein
VLKAWWIISQFRKTVQSGEASEAAVWPLLERPVLLAWKAILEDTGVFLQNSWDENVVAPSRGLSKMEQVYFFYGPQGKLHEFVDQFAKPFLVENESRLGKVLEEEVPLTSGFLSTLREEKQLRPSLASGKDTVHPVRVEPGQESRIDSDMNILEEKTEFLLDCGGTTFKASNQSKTSTTVFWSSATCGEPIITVFVSRDRSCADKASTMGTCVSAGSSSLIKRYTGQHGFLSFIQDFRDGSQVFRNNDFVDTEGTLHQYHINAVTVFYRASVQFALEKLISLLSGFTVPPTIVK